MTLNKRVKAQAIKIGDDVKHIRSTPGARAGVATARAINRGIDHVIYGLTNVADFTICLWRGKA